MVSVVIPAYNEEKWIGKTLDSLVAQKTTEKFEVIVVDNVSTDKTAEIVRSYNRKLQIKLIKEKKKSRGAARRTGFAAAKGEIIFSTDADSVVPEDWIETIMEYFKDEKIVAVTGTCKIYDLANSKNVLFNTFHPISMKLFRVLMGNYWLSGFNFAIRKKMYDESGGFDSQLNAQEDTDLAFRVKRYGKIRYIPDPVVTVSGRRFSDGMVKGLYSYIDTYFKYFLFKDKENTDLSDIR
jgi:cellulose synthase/poly-beta-1,6-N-acetylglucosamine synthase-like glycosyltransferase